MLSELLGDAVEGLGRRAPRSGRAARRSWARSLAHGAARRRLAGLRSPGTPILHSHASVVYNRRVIYGSGSSGRPASRAPNCCGSSLATPSSTVELATGDIADRQRIADLYPSLAGAYRRPALRRRPTPASADGLDVVFLGLPHGASQELVPQLRGKVKHIVDLAADFRLKDAALYPQWYGEEHHAPELLAEFVYGLPELFRPDAAPARRRSPCPAATPTAASLALAPLVRNGRHRSRPASSSTPPAVCRARGGRRSPTRRSARSTRTSPRTDCSTHRHTPEIEQNLSTRPTAPRSARRRRCCSRRTSRR